MASTDKKMSNRRNVYNHISVAEKLEIVTKLDEGIGLSEIAKSVHLAKSTVYNIKKNREKIKSTAKCLSSKAAAAESVRNRNHAILITESLLNTWIINQREKGAALSERLIKTKALSLFENAKAERGIEGSFLASNGWFEKFKQRYKLRNVLSRGESARADWPAASTFVATFEHIVQEGRYNPKQVFNADETGLCVKKLPSRTYIKQEEKAAAEFKADLTMDDITDYMKDEAEEFTNEDLLRSEFESAVDDIEHSVDESLQEERNLKEFLDTAETLKDKMLTVEKDEDNRLRFKLILDGLMSLYKNKHERNGLMSLYKNKHERNGLMSLYKNKHERNGLMSLYKNKHERNVVGN